MDSLLHPVGSQPPGVYWARRGAVVLAVVLVVAALAFVFRPQPEPVVTAQPASASVTPTATTPSAEPTDSASPSASPTPTGPLACDASNTDLALAGYQKVAQDGKQSFKVSITNRGDATCVLTLKQSTFSLTVVSGSDRIWTTDDCEKWVPTASEKLKAGAAYEFTIAWPVARSSTGCKTSTSVLGEGTYVANATFAEDAKARQVFVVTKAG
ncbi:MAG: hypothetical protein QM779_16595 [Propionicimonas sp.]|uniref:hypothetical protein n=1 Tax=Propionicimonas sp. TaxID=1955623 RepID=UPI003D11AAC3